MKRLSMSRSEAFVMGALITRPTSGIGRRTALELAEHGTVVHGTARHGRVGRLLSVPTSRARGVRPRRSTRSTEHTAMNRFLHPVVGQPELHQILLDPDLHQSLLVFTATPRQRSADRLALLVLGTQRLTDAALTEGCA